MAAAALALLRLWLLLGRAWLGAPFSLLPCVRVQRGRGEEGEEEEEETDGFKNAGTVRHRHAHKKGTQDCMHTLLVVLLLLYSS